MLHLVNFCVSLDCFVLELLDFIVFSLVWSVLSSQEIGWEERLQHDLFCIECDIKTLAQ